MGLFGSARTVEVSRTGVRQQQLQGSRGVRAEGLPSTDVNSDTVS